MVYVFVGMICCYNNHVKVFKTNKEKKSLYKRVSFKRVVIIYSREDNLIAKLDISHRGGDE